MDIKHIIESFIELPNNKQQYILNWLSVRYIAVIIKKCTDSERVALSKNMSKGLKERVNDELRINSRELEKPKLVQVAFKTLYDAIHSNEYKKNMKDSSYKRKRS